MSTAEIENDSWKKFYRNGTAIIVFGLLAAVFILMLGWHGWLNYFDDNAEVWFQRSGSLMTVILLIVDYYVYRLMSDVGKSTMVPPFAMATKNKYRPYIKIFTFFAVFFTILATFVWGYGDILFLEVKHF